MSNKYQNPLTARYASEQMQQIFSDDNKFTTFRRLWIALAESQKELGLNITNEQIEEMKQNIDSIDYKKVQEYEKQTRHDVMAHILAFSEQCKKASPIIHLGATSCFVGDNTDIILYKSALLRIKKLLLNTIKGLSEFAFKYKDLATLSYTHFQPAQPTTLGKRASMWIQDLLFDLKKLDFTLNELKLLGCKGTTGTSASFLSLFDNDTDKVTQLENKICKKMGFSEAYPITGQTYTRKIDYEILSVLSSIAQSASKFSSDIRLLSHLKEADEPFEEKQVGSSAMAYKRNPMRSERIASLSRYILVSALNPAITASTQWFERTLDDSANKRIAIPQAFLATDSILLLYMSVINGIKIYPNVIKKHLNEELPFMATENILMYCVKKGGDRQKLHERIRVHSLNALKEIKENGNQNDLIDRIILDKEFNVTREEIEGILSNGGFTGMASLQVEQFLISVNEILDNNRDLLGVDFSIRV